MLIISVMQDFIYGNNITIWLELQRKVIIKLTLHPFQSSALECILKRLCIILHDAERLKYGFQIEFGDQ